MKNMLKLSVSAVIGLLLMPAAIAGLSQPADVDVDLVSNVASGDMVSARNAESDNVFIGCGVRNFDFGDGTTFEFGFCQAEDAEGDRALCSTESPHLLDAVKAMSDYSYISFSFTVDVDENGNEVATCRRIGSSIQSFYLPKIKGKK